MKFFQFMAVFLATIKYYKQISVYNCIHIKYRIRCWVEMWLLYLKLTTQSYSRIDYNVQVRLDSKYFLFPVVFYWKKSSQLVGYKLFSKNNFYHCILQVVSILCNHEMHENTVAQKFGGIQYVVDCGKPDICCIKHTLQHKCKGGTQCTTLRRIKDIPYHELPCQGALKDPCHFPIPLYCGSQSIPLWEDHTTNKCVSTH